MEEIEALTQAPSAILLWPATSPRARQPGLPPVACSNLFESRAETDLCWESRGKEQEREGAAVCGNTGSCWEVERDCSVPLDLHGHSGGLEGSGEALCLLYLDLGAQVCTCPCAAL